MERLDRKRQAAAQILQRCIGKKGVWADPTRYRYQCWTRDFVLAIMPVLLANKQTKIIRTHLENLSLRQRPNGQIPILFLDQTWPFLKDKIRRTFASGSMSFMLRRYLTGSLWNLTPGTRDSEILYLVGMYEYANSAKDLSLVYRYKEQLRLALEYIETNLMKGGLVIGCDWRDTMERELGDRALLTNNSLLYRAYRLMGESRKAEELWIKINERLWNGQSYLDYEGSDRFDPLGGALAIMYGVAPISRYPSLAESFRSVDTTAGVTIKCRHNPVSEEEATVINATDGVVVWPFVVGFTILALRHMGQEELARDQFVKLMYLEGFREWYDPATNRGYGAEQQLWSATLFLRAATALG